MPSSAESLVRLLRGLRKGRGLMGARLGVRLDPDLASFCGTRSDDGDDMIRTKIAATVSSLLDKAPAEVRQAVLAALGVELGAQQLTLTARREWLASRQPCDVRTVRRQEDRGFDLIAAVIAGDALASTQRRTDGGWSVRAFRAILRLDSPTPELLEERTIVAREPGLSQIMLSLSIAPDPAAPLAEPVRADVLYGGRITGQDHSPSHFRFLLDLPRSLRPGEAHDYAVIFRLPPGRRLRPHYVFQPLQPCDRFRLIVRFHLDALPEAVWRLDGVAPREVDDHVPAHDLIEPNMCGEIELGFTALSQGRSYGLAWRGGFPNEHP